MSQVPELRHLRVARTARYYVLGEAADADEVWVVCHGYGQLGRSFVRQFRAIAADGRLIVAPEALNRYYHESAPGVHGADARVGATWMTREDREHEIRDYVDYLDTLTAHIAAEMALPRVVALGFSQGTATVSRWAASGTTALDHVILWGGSIAHDLQPQADLLRGATLTLVAGRSDEYMKPDRIAAERTRLHELGLSHRMVQYDGGHHITDVALRELIAADSA